VGGWVEGDTSIRFERPPPIIHLEFVTFASVNYPSRICHIWRRHPTEVFGTECLGGLGWREGRETVGPPPSHLGPSAHDMGSQVLGVGRSKGFAIGGGLPCGGWRQCIAGMERTLLDLTCMCNRIFGPCFCGRA
jgi:hypothetical protein